MFRTEISIAPAAGQLARTARVLTLGSCFADSIGARLAANKVEALVNPFGTVFQPLALARLLRAAAGETVDWQQHLVEARGRWQSYDLHGSVGADSPVALLQTVQELVRQTGEFLRGADLVLLTLGTAWAYRLRETGELVSNCHKQPADLFERELLTPDDIINSLAETHAFLRRINPELQFVLTVSPVRHLKDTLPLNSVSKSVLRVATHFVSDLLPGVAYFPAYELLLDDLRDYRFYAADMLHPSEVAQDYIWEKFARTYFDADFGRFRKEWAAVQQALGHRPLHAGALEHRQFLEGTLEKLGQLSLRKVGVAAELTQVRAQLAALPVLRQPEPPALVDDDEERVDIGQGPAIVDASAAEEPAVTPPLPAGERPSRLSPEEFRAPDVPAPAVNRPARGRRDGRGKGQSKILSENELFQAAMPAGHDFSETLDSAAEAMLPAAEPGQREHLAGPAAPPLSGSGLIDDGVEPAKKKKRRSRGGAKRTARKNALRLAASASTPDADPPAAEPTAQAAAQDAVVENHDKQPESTGAPAVAEPVPAKRKERHNNNGRAARVALYAAPTAAPAETKTPATTAADGSAAVVAATPTAAPEALLNAPASDSGPVVLNPRNPRNSRSRGKKGVAEAVSAPDTTNPLPVPLPIESAATSAVSPVVAAPQSGRSPAAARRPKRPISGARPEKPAIDTPVVPVPDPLQVRTQVAAGRMTGSSASLIGSTAKPKAAPTKAATPKKVVATEKAAPAKVKAPAAPTVPANSPKAPAPAKSKAVAKPKATAPKSAAPKPAAPKPKPPKKPAKPA